MSKYKKKKHVGKKMNALKCTIPGLTKDMELIFPGRKLPVCEKCKKIYKTRQLCRERDGHTAFPWNKTYICFILDDSCFDVDPAGNQCLVREDGPNPHDFFAENVECSNVKYVARFKASEQLDPICTPCKLKNYTKAHCRRKHGHKFLPWSTVYLKLCARPRKVDVGSKREANCLPTSGTHPEEPTKKTKIEENDNVYSLSTVNGYPLHPNLFSSDRNESEAFLLILVNKRCHLEWLRDASQATSTSDFDEVKAEDDGKDPLQQEMSSLLPEKGVDITEDIKVLTKICKPVNTKQEEELKVNEFNSQLQQIESIQSFSSFDQNVRTQGQDVSFDWTQQQEQEDQARLQRQQKQPEQEQQQQELPPLPPNQNAENIPYGGRNYHDYVESSSYPPTSMTATDRGYYDQYPNQNHHHTQQQYHQQYPNQYPIHLEQPPIMMNHHHFPGHYYQMQGGENDYYPEYNSIHQRVEDSFSNGGGNSSKNHSNALTTCSTNSSNHQNTNNNMDNPRNDSSFYNQKYGPSYGRPLYYYDEYQYQAPPPKTVTPMVIPPGGSTSSSNTILKNQQQQPYPQEHQYAVGYCTTDESRNENSSGTTAATLRDYSRSFDSASQRDQYHH